MRRPAARPLAQNSSRPPDVPLRLPLMTSRLAIETVAGVAGRRPRSVAGGGEASPAPVKGAMDGRDPVCDGRRPTARGGRHAPGAERPRPSGATGFGRAASSRARAAGRERPRGRPAGPPAAGSPAGPRDPFLYGEGGTHSRKSRTRTTAMPPHTLRSTRRTAAAPGPRRDVPGADAAHAPMNTDGASRDCLSGRRGAPTWRTT